MAAFGRRPLLLTAVLLQLLTLGSCQLDCACTADRNRTVNIELDCERAEDGISLTSCGRADVDAIPAGYSAIEGYGIYKLYRTSLEWTVARSFCELEGGRLAIPQDETHFAALVALLEAEPGLEIAYLGVSDLEEDSVYVGVDGNAASYLPWRESQPDHFLDEDGVEEHCVELTAAGTNDIHCTDQTPFICEIPTTLTDYTWVEGANRFIKVHSDDPQTYADAYNTCVSEGGSLAVLETWDAAQAVLRILPEDIGYSFVGFNDNSEEGVFATTTGRLLTDMEYQNWEKDQPDNDQGQDCLALSYNGNYNDLSCNEVTSFICQITRP